MQEPFEDSRRLTGANLYFDGAGAALETASDLALMAAVINLPIREARMPRAATAAT